MATRLNLTVKAVDTEGERCLDPQLEPTTEPNRNGEPELGPDNRLSSKTKIHHQGLRLSHEISANQRSGPDAES